MIRELPDDVDPGEAEWFEAAAGVRCPPVETLNAAMAHVLPEPLGARVREHVAACEACRTLVRAFDEYPGQGPTDEQATRVRRHLTAMAGRRIPFSVLGHAAAAVFVLAAGVAIIMTGWRPFAPEDVAPFGATRGVDRALPPPEYSLALERPAVALPESALVTRGGPDDPFVAELRIGLDLFRREQFAEAARQLHETAQKFPDRPHASFYEGASLLLAGQSSDAVGPLEQTLKISVNDSWLADESAWYLAVAFERSGRRESAIRVLASLCSTGTSRRDAACRGLQALSAGSETRNPGDQGAARPGDCRRREFLDRPQCPGDAAGAVAGN